MTDGTYTYYTIQHRVTHKNKWCELDAPLEPVEKLDEFSFSSFDWMGQFAEPWVGSGNDYKPRYKSHTELYGVWASTSFNGWWSKNNAFNALKRLHKASDAGKLDYKDAYGNLCQRVRFQFRVVKITVSQKTEIL